MLNDTIDTMEEKTSFRCTKKEKEMLQRGAMMQGYANLSDYIRKRLFLPNSNERIFDAEIAEILREMEYNNLKIGTNINQIAKVINSKKSVSLSDREDLQKEINLLHYNYKILMEQLIEMQKRKNRRQENGCDKIIEDQTDKWKK